MRQTLQNIALFVILASLIYLVWYFVESRFFPPPPPAPPAVVKPSKEHAAAVGGFAALASGPHAALKSLPAVKPPEPAKPNPVAAGPAPVVPAKPAEPHRLIALGNERFRKTLILNTQGAGIQQVVLRDFDEADRVGHVVKDGAGKNQKLHLIPGYFRPRPAKVKEALPLIDLPTGLVSDARIKSLLTEASYTLYHYPTKGDPIYRDDDPEAGKFPLPDLGIRTWKVVREQLPADGPQTVAMETQLDAPYFIKVTKTFTLPPDAYHVDFALTIEPLPNRPKDAAAFRYQIAGARGLPIEGEWYTQSFRTGYIGKEVAARPGKFTRDIDDAAQVNSTFGGDLIPKGGYRLAFAAVGTQYFASALAVDIRNHVGAAPWAAARTTREINSSKPTDLPQFDDITIRAIAEPLTFDDGQPVTHHYVIYHGPIKVRLLTQLEGDKAVERSLIDFYSNDLGLKVMTDHHSPYFFGRFANAIGWADAVIAMTNLMHWVLGGLNDVVPIWGLNIIMLTVLVRTCLLFFSRKQQMIAAKAQAKMAALQPQIEALKEKYGADQQTFNQEKTKLFLQNGVLNPKAQLAGCGLLFLQMPIFMGLYFCLQESVFFRLSSFLWIENLAAPDMLFSWSESIPLLSDPANRTGFFSFLYLGPYFNLLPVFSVTLMFIHTKLTMPPATDEIQEQQQKMMKFMMIFMGLFFYKVAAGLCLYFICSTLWGLTERKLLPKPQLKPDAVIAKPNVGPNGKPLPDAKPTGFLARMAAKMEEMQKAAEAQRQIRNTGPNANPRDPRKKKR